MISHKNKMSFKEKQFCLALFPSWMNMVVLHISGLKLY